MVTTKLVKIGIVLNSHTNQDKNCPSKEPEVGGPCKDKSLECSFKIKEGTSTFTCPDKKWEYIAVGVPLVWDAKGNPIGDKSKENGTWHNTITWNGVSCPSKEPKVGDACKHKGLKCPFKTKEGNKTFTCPDKKWEASALGVPLFVNAKGCPKKAPQIKKPCSKPESLRCSYPDVTMGEGCPPLEHKCMKGKDGKKIWVDEGVC